MPNIRIDVEWVGLDDAFDELEDELTNTIRGMTVLAWNRVLEQTPQFYGRLAASWNYRLNSPVYSDRSSFIDTESINEDHSGDVSGSGVNAYQGFGGFWKGHAGALRIANSFNTGEDSLFKLGDTVYFSNGVDHGEGPYAEGVETGEIALRPVNRPGRMAGRALDYLAARFANDVRRPVALQLQTLRIGV